MSKKLQQVKSEKQLIGGQLYLRLVVNCHGNHWVEIVKVFGSSYGFKPDRRISTGYFSGNRLYKRDWGGYLTDLGVMPYKKLSSNWAHASGRKLFRFNSYSLRYLQGLGQFEACALIKSNSNHPVVLTDKEKMDMQKKWEYYRWVDEQSQKEREQLYA